MEDPRIQEYKERLCTVGVLVDEIFVALDSLNGLEVPNASARKLSPALTTILVKLHRILGTIGRPS